VKELLKSVCLCQSHPKNKSMARFMTHGVKNVQQKKQDRTRKSGNKKSNSTKKLLQDLQIKLETN